MAESKDKSGFRGKQAEPSLTKKNHIIRTFPKRHLDRARPLVSRWISVGQPRSLLHGLLCLAGLALLLSPLATAQVPYPYSPLEDTSYLPTKGDDASDIDTIDLDTGNLTVETPLISYPQRGGILHADFTLVGALPGSVLTTYFIPSGQGREIWQYCSVGGCGEGEAFSGAPGVIFSGFPSLKTLFQPAGTDQSFVEAWILEADGANHLVGWTTPSQGRSLDGTGFSVNGDSAPYTITDKDGVSTSYSSSSSTVVMTDPNGNQMTANAGIITDTVGRQLQLPTSAPASGWALPGIDGGTVTFKFTQPSATETVVTLPNNTSYTSNIRLWFCHS